MSEIPDLATLTGVRSGKRSYYSAYVRSDERMRRAVRAMDSISRALVRTVEGPRGLLEEVVLAAREHLSAHWALLVLGEGQLPGARPRVILADRDGRVSIEHDPMPAEVRAVVAAVQAGVDVAAEGVGGDGWVRVPMVLEGSCIGSLVALHGLRSEPEPYDLAVLRILANQAAVSLHTSEQYQEGLALHRRAQVLNDEAQARSRDLQVRTRELREVEHRLVLAHQRELIDTERHRIARELHDSVTQYVLSAGMAVEVARGEVAAMAQAPPAAVGAQLDTAKELSQQAVDQLRRAIYALNRSQTDTLASLPDLLREMAAHHKPRLEVMVRVEGKPEPLPADADHEIARAVGEALFNVAAHAGAVRSLVRLSYRPDLVRAVVSDDGDGDPAELSRILRLERGASDGSHRGLANIESRVTELGGTVRFRRSRMGGVRVEMRVPLPLPESVRSSTMIHNLVRSDVEEA